MLTKANLTILTQANQIKVLEHDIKVFKDHKAESDKLIDMLEKLVKAVKKSEYTNRWSVEWIGEKSWVTFRDEVMGK